MTTLALLLLPLLSSALPHPQTPEDIPSGGIGYDPSAQGDEDAGSDGADTGAVTLSKGAIIAISIVAAVVVFGGIALAVLFYLAKRRQWQIAATLRRSVKRVGTGITRVMTPRTPHKMTFSPIEKRRNNSDGDVLLNQHTRTKSGTAQPSSTDREREREKGLATVNEDNTDNNTYRNSGRGAKGKKLPPVTVPQSKFEMDSPKTPLWSKVFGR